MEYLAASDLKTILHSKRANLYYPEHCRVLVNGGRVEYVTDQGKQSLYWHIPVANTTAVLLWSGDLPECLGPVVSGEVALHREGRPNENEPIHRRENGRDPA